MYKKIYIIGPVGSGKTSFSKELSKKYHIKCYELDKIIWDDNHNNRKRTKQEINKLFNNILNNKSWIIEDVGRDIFKQGRVDADIIYYLKQSKIKSYYLVIKRWIKQKIGIEKYNYPPDIIYIIKIVNSYYKKEKDKMNNLKEYNNKLVILYNKDINKRRNNEFK